MNKIDFYKQKLECDDRMAKEIIVHCEQREVMDLQERVMSLMVSLGLRIKAIPSGSKQEVVWQAYNQDGSLGLVYTKKYEYRQYKLQLDVHNLDPARLNDFYKRWKDE